MACPGPWAATTREPRGGAWMPALFAAASMTCAFVDPVVAATRRGQLRLGAGAGVAAPYQHLQQGPEVLGTLEYGVSGAVMVGTGVRFSHFDDTFDPRTTKVAEVSLFLRFLGRSGHSWHPCAMLGPSLMRHSSEATEEFPVGGEPLPGTAESNVVGRAGVGFLHDLGDRVQWGAEVSYAGPTGFGGDQLLGVYGLLNVVIAGAP